MVLCLIVIAAVILADQLSKILCVKYLIDAGSVRIVPKIVNFTYVENRGAAFGMLADHRWVFMVLSVAAIALIVVYLAKAKPQSVLQRVSIALIAGGGIGNMIDRVFRGYVVDFIDVQFVKFYVFNVADSAVCVGCGLLVIWAIASEVKSKKQSRE